MIRLAKPIKRTAPIPVYAHEFDTTRFKKDWGWVADAFAHVMRGSENGITSAISSAFGFVKTGTPTGAVVGTVVERAVACYTCHSAYALQEAIRITAPKQDD